MRQAAARSTLNLASPPTLESLSAKLVTETPQLRWRVALRSFGADHRDGDSPDCLPSMGRLRQPAAALPHCALALRRPLESHPERVDLDAEAAGGARDGGEDVGEDS